MRFYFNLKGKGIIVSVLKSTKHNDHLKHNYGAGSVCYFAQHPSQMQYPFYKQNNC